MLKERMPGDEEREVVAPYFEAIINRVSAATTEGKKSFDPSSSRQLEEGWRDRYSLLLFNAPRNVVCKSRSFARG
jgi:hypothetical protein